MFYHLAACCRNDRCPLERIYLRAGEQKRVMLELGQALVLAQFEADSVFELSRPHNDFILVAHCRYLVAKGTAAPAAVSPTHAAARL